MADTVLSLPDLQKHLIKTIIGSIVSSVSIAIIIGISFYYRTTYSMESIQSKQTEMSVTLDKHVRSATKCF